MERRLLKRGTGGAIAEFSSTDTIPAANLPALVISPSQITSDQDNYGPTGWDTASVVRLNFDTGGRGITGFAAWTNEYPKRIVNTSANFGYIACEHPDSTAANRVVGACDYIIPPYGTLILIYDGTSSRVRVVGNSYNPAAPGSGIGGHFYHSSGGATLGSDWGDINFTISSGNNGASAATSTLPGGWEINTSTSAAGASSLNFTKTAGSVASYGGGHIIFSCTIYIPTLSDGTNTYTLTAGLVSTYNSTTLDAPGNASIKYSHGLNSGNFLGVTRTNAGVESTVNLGVTVATNTVYVLTVCIPKDRSEARFYVDGVYAGRTTSNIPDAGSAGARVMIIKSAGTTQRNAVVSAISLITAF